MKSLQTLIRYHKQQLDEKRRALVALEEKKDALLAQIATIEKAIADEIDYLRGHEDTYSTFSAFLISSKEKIDVLKHNIANFDKQIAVVRQEIQESFSEMKKFEIVFDQKLLDHQHKLERKETLEMDEIATMRFLRENQGE